MSYPLDLAVEFVPVWFRAPFMVDTVLLYRGDGDSRFASSIGCRSRVLAGVRRRLLVQIGACRSVNTVLCRGHLLLEVEKEKFRIYILELGGELVTVHR